MTTDGNTIQPGDPADLNAAPAVPEPAPQPPAAPVQAEDIVSVNKRSTPDNKLAKGLFLLLVGSMLVGLTAWFSQNWVNARKAQMKAHSGPRATEDTSQVFNPEKTGATPPKPKLGSDSGLAPPSQSVSEAGPIQPGATRDDGIRPLRGADGKVMVNPQGRAMGVDRSGKIVEVPAIEALAGDQSNERRPLPGATAGAPGQGAGEAAQQKPPSRFGGSIFVGDAPKPPNVSTANGAGNAQPSSTAQTQAEKIAEILRVAGMGGRPGSGSSAQVPTSTSPLGQGSYTPSEPPRAGTVGSALYSSATPVALAQRMPDQNLILPKGRQADCILTGRIIDEVPGFTSCVLSQNMYSDNGRVLLLERGSELTGEYGVTNQLGLERLFVTWSRLKTPAGITIDLSSPGADSLGTSGIPGHVDNRWGARIGAAFLLSFVKDITVAAISAETKDTSGGTSVNVQTTPGQNTLNTSSSLAEEVIKQTIKVRPRMTVNEGDRISIYVARDLDFSPVYALKTAGIAGFTKLLTK